MVPPAVPRKLGHENLGDPILDHARRDWIALQADQTVGAALEALRTAPELPEKIVYFYVVAEDGRLVGVVPTRRLLAAAPGATMASLMVSEVVSIPSTATVGAAAEAFVRHRFLAVPILDEAGRIAAVIDIGGFTEEIAAAAERRSWEDVFQLIGVHVAHARRASAWAAFRERFPWLLCNIAGGLVCAFLAGLYERLLDSAIVLALFVPVVLALAESVSVQSTTMTLQWLHGVVPTPRHLLRSLTREFGTAALLGAASGGAVGMIAWLWKRDGPTAVAIGGAILLSMISACLLGVAVPTGVRLLRRDPKLAAGPLVLATADVATLLFYFCLAGWLLG